MKGSSKTDQEVLFNWSTFHAESMTDFGGIRSRTSRICCCLSEMREQYQGFTIMLIWLVVLVSAIWVLIDAKNIGVKKGLVSGMANIGPWGWFFVTLGIWIIGFPMYLYYRDKFKIAVKENLK